MSPFWEEIKSPSRLVSGESSLRSLLSKSGLPPMHWMEFSTTSQFDFTLKTFSSFPLVTLGTDKIIQISNYFAFNSNL